MKIFKLFGIVHLVQNIIQFASDNVKPMSKQKQSNANARMINVVGNEKENHAVNFTSLVHKIIFKPEVKPEMEPDSFFSGVRAGIFLMDKGSQN